MTLHCFLRHRDEINLLQINPEHFFMFLVIAGRAKSLNEKKIPAIQGEIVTYSMLLRQIGNFRFEICLKIHFPTE